MTAFSRSPIDGDQPVVGVEGDRLAALDLLAADRRVTDRLGHDHGLDGASRLGHRTGVARLRRVSGRAPAARRSPRRRSGSGRRRRSARSSRRPGARQGRRSGCWAGAGSRGHRPRSTACSSSPVLGFEVWPPWTTPATPKSRKIAARPSPATTAMTPSGRTLAPSDAAAPEPFRSGSVAPSVMSPSGSPPDIGVRGERRGPCLADVAAPGCRGSRH